jgi:hypothetical protein
MDVSHPNWNSQESAYVFTFIGTVPTVRAETVFSNDSSVTLPDVIEPAILSDILTVFLEKTKRFFVSPIHIDLLKKHLRHYVADTASFPTEGQFFQPVWKPSYLKMKSNEFGLFWSVVEWKPSEPVIRSDFFQTAQQSPELLRTIHIQNTMDSLVPVGDLPLSDLPPLHFGEESPEKREVRRRIREARLKVELAKLKAKRMEQKYYERYGDESLEMEDSSLESSETDSMEGKYSYS